MPLRRLASTSSRGPAGEARRIGDDGLMNSIDVLRDLAQRPMEALGYFWDRLDPAKLNVHPGGHPNSPAWLIWHSGRGIDVQVAHLAGHEQTWVAKGFDARFGLGLSARDIGYGHTAQQARAITVPETADGKSMLRDYLAAVTEQVDGYLRGLTEAELGEVIDTRWNPPVTRGVRLVSAFADALQHVGQAAYVAGMR